MSTLNDWDIVDANNDDAPPDGWPESTMNYSDVNDAGRAVQGTMKRFFADINGSLTAGGIADAYTLTLNETGYVAYFAGMYFACKINAANTGAATMNVNAIGAIPILTLDGNALVGDEITAGVVYVFRHDGTNLYIMRGNAFSDAEQTKLAGIETGATTDQTNAEIRTAVEAATDSNVFTDADHSKLNGIETSADVTDTANVTSAGALMDSEVDADIKTLSLPASVTISAFIKTLLDDVAASNARTTLGVDAAGTDNSDDNAVNSLYSSLVTNATHSGHVSGSGVLTLLLAAITGQTDIGAAIVDADEIIINDSGTGIRRSDVSRLNTYITAKMVAAVHTWAAKQTFNGELALNAGYSEDADQYTATTGTRTLDTSAATYFYPSADLGTATITFAFSNPAVSGRVTSFTMELLGADGATLTWPASVDWGGGNEPVWTSGRDLVTFVTRDNGATWYGMAAGLAFS